MLDCASEGQIDHLRRNHAFCGVAAGGKRGRTFVSVSPVLERGQSSIGVASSWKNRLGLIAETPLARGEQIVTINII